MPDIITTGEMLIDFTPVPAAGYKGAVYPNPGGAPGNVAVQLSRLGVSTGFIGKVGNDNFGHELRHCLSQNGVDTKNLIEDPYYRTTLAFVHLDESGDRSFTFYRNPGADTQLRVEEVDMSDIDGCRLLHFGSLSLTTEPGRSTTLELVKRARNMGKLISYDPNWRPNLWNSVEEGVAGMEQGLKLCHILKISGEEMALLTETDSIIEGAKRLHKLGVKLIVVTLGPEGCVCSLSGRMSHHPTYDMKVIDTTGSGDSFFGAFLSQLIQNGYNSQEAMERVTLEELAEFCQFSNAAGSLCATRQGGIPALPKREEILRCMEEGNLLETEFRLR